jgi:Tfp pilus assembly protein PilN
MESKRRTTAPSQPKTLYEQKKVEAEAKNTPAVSMAEPLAYDVSMKLTGIANNDVQVAQFLSKLAQSKLLKDVNLVISEEHKQADEKLRKFQIEMNLDRTAELKPAQKNKTAAIELGK